MKEITEEEMLRKAAAYCAEAERCRGDVEKKIARAGLEVEAAERILARLEKEGFIDDERYCRFFVNDKLRFNKWGRMKIALELRKKGIPAATYENALRNIAHPAAAVEKADNARERRAGMLLQAAAVRGRTRIRACAGGEVPARHLGRRRL